MTIASTVTKKIYDADGVTRDWPITMETSGISSSEIKVYLVDEDGVSTLVTANYDVDLTALSVEYPTVVSGLDPIASPNKILLVRELALTQPTDYKNQGDVPAETIEEGLDRLTEVAQQLQEQVDRSVKSDISENSGLDYEDFVAVKNDCDAAKAAAEVAQASAEAVLTDAGFVAVAADLIGDDNIGTVADSISDVNDVADNVIAIAAVNANETNINAVNSNKTNIDAVAGNSTNINAVAGNSTNINAVNANKTNIDKVAAIDSDVSAVADIDGDVTTCADNIDDISTVADNIGTIGDKISGDGTVNPMNLLSNGGFKAWSAGTSAAPDGWVIEGTTPAIARDTGDIGYGSYSAKITASGAGSQGLKYTLSGLKASTTYSVSWRTKVTAGDTSQVLTTGAGTNLSSTESTSTTFETKTGSFITDASGTAVVLKFLAKADGDVVWFDGIQVNEGSSAFAFSPKPMIYEDVRYEVINFSRNIASGNGAVNYTTTAGKVPKSFIFSGGLVGYCFFTGNDDKTTKGSTYHAQGGVVGAGITDASIIITDGAANTEKGYVSGATVNQFTITWTATAGSPTGTAYISALVFY